MEEISHTPALKRGGSWQSRRLASAFCIVAIAASVAGGSAEQLAGSALDAAPSGQADAAKLSREALLADFRVARAALEEGHSGIYRYTKRADLERSFDDAERAIDRPMDAYELYRLLAPAVAAIKCGHTRVALPKELGTELVERVPLLPLQVRVIRGVPYVFRDFSSPSGSLAGKEIRSVGGVPADRIVKTLVAAAPGDGDIATSREAAVGDWRFATDLVRLLGLKSPYRVTLRDARADRESSVELAGVVLPALLEASRSRYPQDQRVDRSADLALLDGGATARMTVRAFYGLADPAAGKDMRRFFEEAFVVMRERGTRSLVLDLRGNGGGEDALGRILLSYLVDAPFKYYEDLVLNKTSFDLERYASGPIGIPANLVERGTDGRYRAVGHPNWGTQKPSEPVFRGRVVALIDGGSFSTTCEFLSHLHDRRRATFVGAESGGGYFGNTSGPSAEVVLPNSKLVVQVPLLTYYMAVKGRGGATRGVIPDFDVRPTVADLIAGRDPAMEKALELARASLAERR